MTESAQQVQPVSARLAVGDRLFITAWNALSVAVTLLVHVRQLTHTGQIVESYDELPLVADALETTFYINMTAGYLLDVTVTLSSTTTPRGTVYAVIGIAPNSAPTSTRDIKLSTGYPGYQAPLIYPGQPPTASGDIEAITKSIYPVAPVPGLNLELTYNAQAAVRVRGGKFTLDTSAAVANRYPYFTISTGTADLLSIISPTAHTASLSKQYVLWFGPGRPADTASLIFLQLPDLGFIIEPTYKIGITAINATDELSAIALNTQTMATPDIGD